MTAAVSVDELQRAWTAIAAGAFRADGVGQPAGLRRMFESQSRDTATRWIHHEPAVVVAGATGRVGASIVALATATAAERPTRLVECSPMHTTGLAAATTAELGITERGWRQGDRDHLLIERTAGTHLMPEMVPSPDETDRVLTIVDVGWNLAQICGSNSWLSAITATAPLVLVTVATVPGLRALDNALQLTGRPADTWCAVTGPTLKKWPKELRLATSAAIDSAINAGRLLTVPEIPALRLTGITPDPLPPRLVSACRPILDQTAEHTKGNNHHVPK